MSSRIVAEMGANGTARAARTGTVATAVEGSNQEGWLMRAAEAAM